MSEPGVVSTRWVDPGSATGSEPVRAVRYEAMSTGPLRSLTPGQLVPFGGDRVAIVSDELAAAFADGDRLVVVQETGDLLHIPAREAEAAATAVSRAAAAFARMGEVGDDAITAFFEAFAGRLENDDAWSRGICDRLLFGNRRIHHGRHLRADACQTGVIRLRRKRHIRQFFAGVLVFVQLVVQLGATRCQRKACHQYQGVHAT